MSSSIQGSGSGQPPWNDGIDSRNDARGEGDDVDVNSRVSEEAGAVFDSRQEGISQLNASEGANSDLQGRVGADHEEGFIRHLLNRIRAVVSRMWGRGSRSYGQRAEVEVASRSCAEFIRESEQPQEAVEQARQLSPQMGGCLASVRKFFQRVFKNLCCCCVAKREKVDHINFQGVDPQGPEGSMALAIMLRMTCKWAANDEINFQIGRGKSGLTMEIDARPLGAIEGSGDAVKILSGLVGGKIKADDLATTRGLAKLASLSHSTGFHCEKHIKDLARKDRRHDYGPILAAGKQIDAMAKHGPEGVRDARQLLTSIRVGYSQVLGQTLGFWLDSMRTGTLNLDYDMVTNVVETNLPILQEARETDPKHYEELVNELVLNCFLSAVGNGNQNPDRG
ncbi:TmeB family type III secretion system effector [Chlamydia vaughanii]|uniref:TmeB family type III secretion system effector n=1 Tax=Chlamydia vaughanii TaxID=3112552 RepID=UPI0032B20FAA